MAWFVQNSKDKTLFWSQSIGWVTANPTNYGSSKEGAYLASNGVWIWTDPSRIPTSPLSEIANPRFSVRIQVDIEVQALNSHAAEAKTEIWLNRYVRNLEDVVRAVPFGVVSEIPKAPIREDARPALRAGRIPDWPTGCQKRALAQGWGIFDDSERGYQLQFHQDDPDVRFTSDEEVWRLVASAMEEGDTLTGRALDFLRYHSRAEYDLISALWNPMPFAEPEGDEDDMLNNVTFFPNEPEI